jgi:hypothetical protein
MSVSTVSKLDHLEGMTVKILGNGGVVPEAVVTGGIISLGSQYNKIIVGLGYNKIVETLDIDFGSVTGTAYGSRGKVLKIFFKFFETVGGSAGFDEDSLTELLFRKGSDALGEGVSPFSGEYLFTPKGGFNDSIKVRYENSDPLPVTITGMVIKAEINE